MPRIYDPQVEFVRRFKKLHDELSDLTIDSVDVIEFPEAPQGLIRILLPDIPMDHQPAYVQVSMTVTRVLVVVVAREKIIYSQDLVLREAVEKVFSLVNSEFTEDSVDMWLV